MRVFIILLMSSIIAEGTITLSCTPLIPEEGTSATCTCKNSVANGIEWAKDSSGFVSCPSPGFCFTLSGYNLSSTGNEYSLEILSYTFTSCGIYTCRDNADNNVNDSVTIDMYDFTDTSPTGFQSQPANHSNGKIEIETECLFYKDKDDIKIEWYTVEGSKIEPYNTTNGTYSNETACSDTCNNKPAMKMNIGFEHKEEADQSNARNVRFKLVVYHKENPAKKLELTTDNEYSIIKATIPPPGTITTEGFPWWVILIIVIVCLYLCGIVIGIFMFCCKDEPLNKIYVGDKTYWWIFLLIIVISGLGILTVYLICKYCGRFNEKQQPCETERGERKRDRQRKEKGDMHLMENKNKPHRPQPAPPVNSLENREESGSAVSRKDVDLQDQSNTLHKRKLPDISKSEPGSSSHNYNGHDNKGRGLSANFDDNYHPITSVGIPERKKGALDPLEEGAGDQAPKKLKRNKKKRSEDDDQF